MASEASEPEPERFIAYHVRPRPDGNLDVRISDAHKALVLYLSKEGGEAVLDWDAAERRRTSEMEKRKETIKQHMAHLVTLGVITEVPLFGTGRYVIRLTDMGRNIASAILGAV